MKGFFRPDLFLDYLRYFVLFEADGDALIKKIAGYHQFHGVRDAVRAKMRILIRQLLRKYKYPPEGQEAATALVLKQAEALAEAWSSGARSEERRNAVPLSS